MHRSRACDNPAPQAGGRLCEGPVQELQSCFAQKDCPRDGKWSAWGEWSACSVTCGRGGSTSRYRSCNNPRPAADGRPCNGLGQSVKPCEAPIKCPVNGQWSEWTEWTECSVTCGNGEQRRLRGCDTPPPQFGGLDCDRTEAGEQQVRSCNGQLFHCPVDGGWSNWGEWGKCYTPDCENPEQISYHMRERSCDSPAPAHNGSMCQGSFLGAAVCLQPPLNCKVNGGWSEWSEWTKCDEKVEVIKRERECNNPSPLNGGMPCSGGPFEFYAKGDAEYRELCPNIDSDDEDLQDGSGSGMEMDSEEYRIDPRNFDGI